MIYEQQTGDLEDEFCIRQVSWRHVRTLSGDLCARYKTQQSGKVRWTHTVQALVYSDEVLEEDSVFYLEPVKFIDVQSGVIIFASFEDKLGRPILQSLESHDVSRVCTKKNCIGVVQSGQN